MAGTHFYRSGDMPLPQVLHGHLWPLGAVREQRAYLLLDSARGGEAMAWLERLAVDTQPFSLFQGGMAQALGDVSPYLLPVAAERPDWADLVQSLWQGGWGLFLTASGAPRDLARHLAGFVLHSLPAPDGIGQRTMIFRFWDARVLPLFLTSCPPERLELFLGPVDGVWLPAPDGGLAHYGQRPGGGLLSRHWPPLPDKGA